MDKMVSKIKSLEKKVSGSSSKKKKAPTFLRSRSFSPLQGGSLPKSLTEPLLSSQGKEKTTQRRRKSFKARRSSSTTGLDRVQTEETQLDRADGRVDLEEPQFEDPDLIRSNALPGAPRSRWNPYGQYELAMLHQGQGSHTHFNEEGGRRGAASSIE
ncbi:unnamed protein product [Microthlaspi erraticum]|uniref:Uncharacterized protein n=1 Tax=Microthlaspi erraticum TaxID=1685480 RepID=A0A6D2ITK1_9BRAS|nr:unnamed protein product [Microthlaspi erraticum]